MFGESTVGNIVGVGVILLFGAYVHYRVSTRRKQTRLAVCLLEEEDSLLVDELESMIEKHAMEPIKDTYATPSAPAEPVVKRRKPRKAWKPAPAIA